jgi:hypothetical protein
MSPESPNQVLVGRVEVTVMLPIVLALEEVRPQQVGLAWPYVYQTLVMLWGTDCATVAQIERPLGVVLLSIDVMRLG